MSNVLDCFSHIWFQHNISPKLPQTLWLVLDLIYMKSPRLRRVLSIFSNVLSFLSPWIPWWILPLEFSQEKKTVSVGKNRFFDGQKKKHKNCRWIWIPIFWWTNPDSLGNLPIFNPNTISICILELLHFCCWIVLDFLICRSFPLNSFIGVVFKPCVVLSKTAWLRTGFPQKNWLQYSPKILVSISPYTLW